MKIMEVANRLRDAVVQLVGGFDSNGTPIRCSSFTAGSRRISQLEQAVERFGDEILTLENDPVAWMFTNVQSGDIEASTDPEAYDPEMWHREPLYK